MALRLGWLRSSLVEDQVTASLTASKFARTVKEYDGGWLVPHKVMVMADPATTVSDPNPETCSLMVSEFGKRDEDEVSEITMATCSEKDEDDAFCSNDHT
jgi:hypothetical protein